MKTKRHLRNTQNTWNQAWRAALIKASIEPDWFGRPPTISMKIQIAKQLAALDRLEGN